MVLTNIRNTMMFIYQRVCLFFLLTIISLQGHAALQVFACEPEWKALVEELGGEHVNVFSATNAFQDPHHIEARPSLIAKMRNADLLVCTGADLEVAWLPLLLRQSGNKKLLAGLPGNLSAAEFIERLEVPKQLDRSMGDVHAMGNPHIHLDPHRLLMIAKELNQRLKIIDGNNGDYYDARFEKFSHRWNVSIKKWEAEAQVLKNKKAIVYHRSWSYLFDWLGIVEVADLEPKPGIPPSSTHLVKLLQEVEQQKPDFILLTAYQDDKGAKWLSEKSAVPILRLPYTVGGNESAKDLFTLFESTINILKKSQ